MTQPAHQRLTIFQADDATPLLGLVVSGNVVTPTCTTEPTGTRPFMTRVEDWAESSINFVDGSADIGVLNVTILDKRTNPADQTSGWFTGLLADSSGNNRISGYRCLVEQMDGGGSWYTMMNGIVCDISLIPGSLVEYKLEIKDMREREKSVPLFNVSNGNMCLLPMGVRDGWGFFNGIGNAVVGPVRGVKATFTTDPTESRCGLANVKDMNGNILPDIQTLLDIQSAANMLPSYDGTGNISGYRYGFVGIRWRAWGSTGAWTQLVNMPVYQNTTFSSWISAFTTLEINYLFPRGGPVVGIAAFILSSDSGAGLPSNGEDIEIVMNYYGQPTDDFPLLIECSFGQLLKDCYDGVYSAGAPKIHYDATAIAAMLTNTPIARVRITSPEDDMLTWVQDNIYQPLGYAPGLSAKGEILPIRYAIPDATVTLVSLDDSNVQAAEWMHSYEDVYNTVTFTYQREVGTGKYGVAVPSQGFISQLIVETDVHIIDVFESAALFGPKVVDFTPVTIRTLGAGTNNLSGDLQDELGTLLARARAKELFDRFSYGSQRVKLSAFRDSTGVANLKAGDWVVLGTSYLPDYVTGVRGIDRLMQVVTIQDHSSIIRKMELLDSGPAAAPLSIPTIGSLSYGASHVTVTISSIPSGCDARVDFAVAAALPDVNSGVWTYVGRISSAGTVQTPFVPHGTTIWVRARSEAVGRRPSAWSAVQHVTIPIAPVVAHANIDIHDDSNPIIGWDPDDPSYGYRVYWQTFADSANPTTFTDFVDVRADAGTVLLPDTMTLKQFENIFIRIVPYDGWTGTAVTGSAGGPVMLKGKRISPTYAPPTFREQQSQTDTVGTLLIVEYDPQFRIEEVEFRTQEGKASSWSSWAADSLSPYTTDVNLISADVSLIEYRITTIDQIGSLNITQGGQVQFLGGAIAGFVECRVSLVSATATQEVYQCDGISPDAGTVQVELIAVTGSASLASGPSVGTLSATGTQWTFNRGAALGGAGQIHFRAIETGLQTDDDFAEVPEQGRDTIALTIQATVTASTATQITVDVTVTDPITQGSGAYLQLSVADHGTGGITPSTLQTIVNGGTVTYTILRPAFGAGTGQVFWTATATNRVEDFDAVDVPAQQRDTLYCECQAHITSVSATQVTIQVDGKALVGTPQVKLVGVTGSASQASGPSVGTLSSSGSSWVFNRGSFQSGMGEARFRAVLSGYEDDDDMSEIADQGRDTIGLQMRTTVTNVTSTTVSVSVVVVDPIPANTVTLAAPVIQNATIDVTGSVSLGAGGGTQGYVITRPAFGNGPGGVTFRASSSGRVDDADRVDVQCQEKTSFGGSLPSLDVNVVPGSTSYSIGYGATGTVTFRVDNGSYSTPGSNPFTVSRNSAGGVDKVVTLKATLDSQIITNSVTVPAQDATGGGGVFCYSITIEVTDETTETFAISSTFVGTYDHVHYFWSSPSESGGAEQSIGGSTTFNSTTLNPQTGGGITRSVTGIARAYDASNNPLAVGQATISFDAGASY